MSRLPYYLLSITVFLCSASCQTPLQNNPQPALLTEFTNETHKAMKESLKRLIPDINVVIDKREFLKKPFVNLEPPNQISLEGRRNSGQYLEGPVKLYLIKLNGVCYFAYKGRQEPLFGISCRSGN